MSLMGQDALKSNLSLPQRAYLFDVLIPVPIGDGDFNTLQVRARSTQIPSRSNEVISIPYKQTAGIVIAGKDKLEHTWTCTFMEGEDQLIWNAISTWQQTIVDSVAGISNGNYQTDVYLNMDSTAGNTTMNLKLKNAWISNVGAVALNYEGAGAIVTYSVTFSFDYFIDQNA